MSEYRMGMQATLSGDRIVSTEKISYARDGPRLGIRQLENSQENVDADTSSTLQRVDWVCFTGRYPYVFDAARLGYAVGHRENESYQWSPSEVSLPVHFLDNNYRDANLSRFVNRVREYNPEIAVLGDIYDQNELDEHLRMGERLWDSFPDLNLILVPKTREVLHDIPEKYVLGFPNGDSNIQGTDVAPYHEWQSTGNDIHILGGSPLQIYDAICELTTVRFNAEPATIAGLDCNRFLLWSHSYGDYASAEGGAHNNLRDSNLSYRTLILYSLINAREFWLSKGIWPEERPLTSPSEFQKALRGVDEIDTLRTSAAQELALTPVAENAEKDPLCRTDTTRDKFAEPLSLSKLLKNWLESAQQWQPDGVCSKAAIYMTELQLDRNWHCDGCGRHIEADYTPAERTATWFDPTVVYYQTDDSTHEYETGVENEASPCAESSHYKSAATDAPEYLVEPLSQDGPARKMLYCCESCRKRTEYTLGHELSSGGVSGMNFNVITEYRLKSD